MSNKFVEINNCGFITTNNEKNKKVIEKRESRKDYMLVYFVSNGGYFEEEGKLFTIKEGDIVFIKPGVPLNFSYNHKAQHYWIHFDGVALEYILPICGLDKTGVYTIGKSQNIIKTFSKMIFSLDDNDPVAQIRCSSIFLGMLCDIAEIIKGNTKVKSSNSSLKITPALEHMKYLYYENHSMGACWNRLSIVLRPTLEIMKRILWLRKKQQGLCSRLQIIMLLWTAISESVYLQC